MIGETNSVCAALPVSGTNAELGAELSKPFVVAQVDWIPEVTAVVQPEGKAGAGTPSKFSLNVISVDTAPNRIVKVTVPRLELPSCSWSVAVTVPPQLPLAVKVKGFATAAPPAAKAP